VKDQKKKVAGRNGLVMKIAFGSTNHLNIFISEALKNMLGNGTNAI
jgi:hypothetical protein